MINAREFSVTELKQGYTDDDSVCQCIFCCRQYFAGDIYTFGNRMVDARTAIKLHIAEEHSSVFDALISEGKKVTGLSKVQSELLSYFHERVPDKEIAAKTNTAPSTVRYQRFNLREKAKQARVFLALFELMEEQSNYETNTKIHKGATMVDERYMTTDDESKKIIENFFISTDPLILKTFSSKEKKKIVILRTIAEQFEKDRKYSEKEVNDILKSIYGDFATIRRYLIEYGFLDRTRNGSEYWLS